MKKLFALTSLLFLLVATSWANRDDHSDPKSPAERVEHRLKRLSKELNLSDAQQGIIKSMATENAAKIQSIKNELKEKQLAFHTKRESLESQFLAASHDEKVRLMSMMETELQAHKEQKKALKSELKSLHDKIDQGIRSALNSDQINGFDQMIEERKLKRMEKKIIRKRMGSDKMEDGPVKD